MLFLMFSGIFSITAISCNPVIRWAYQQVLAVEVKNFAKITFLSFNTTADSAQGRTQGGGLGLKPHP